ncbi:MAG: CBS domain-containing protein [Saprospiraceae bacterium]|nr:CBS domain-containing protein [Saprospiraceae bacterium]
MLASNLTSRGIFPVRASYMGREVLNLMAEYHVRHLPVVTDNKLVGIITEEQILSQNKEESIGSYNINLVQAQVKHNDHTYEIMKMMSEYGLTLVPVVDQNDDYAGVVTVYAILKHLTNAASFAEPGGVIVLEMNKNHYSLEEIARIVESENALILSTFVTSYPESTLIEVTLKLNTQKLSHIIATLNRFEYTIKASFVEHHYEEVLKDRYDSLIAYLNV